MVLTVRRSFEGLRMSGLSYRQTRMLVAVGEFWREKEYGPSFRDVMARARVSSTSVAAYNLRILRSCGLVAFDDGVERSLRLTERGRELVSS